jgi:hypothetical protein
MLPLPALVAKWQTRTLEVRVEKSMGVRVSPSALYLISEITSYLGWSLLLVKKALLPFGIALHSQRMILEMRQQHRGDLNIIREHFACGKSRFRIIDLIEVGNRRRFPFDI